MKIKNCLTNLKYNTNFTFQISKILSCLILFKQINSDILRILCITKESEIFKNNVAYQWCFTLKTDSLNVYKIFGFDGGDGGQSTRKTLIIHRHLNLNFTVIRSFTHQTRVEARLSMIIYISNNLFDNALTRICILAHLFHRYKYNLKYVYV